MKRRWGRKIWRVRSNGGYCNRPTWLLKLHKTSHIRPPNSFEVKAMMNLEAWCDWASKVSRPNQRRDSWVDCVQYYIYSRLCKRLLIVNTQCAKHYIGTQIALDDLRLERMIWSQGWQYEVKEDDLRLERRTIKAQFFLGVKWGIWKTILKHSQQHAWFRVDRSTKSNIYL